MKLHSLFQHALLIGCSLSVGEAFGAVTAEEAVTLKTTLTPLGAERAGNKDGSIPAWDGKAPSIAGATNGEKRPDPFASDKVVLTINAANAAAYAEKLTDGTRALLAKYPSFHLQVYPTRRSGVFPQAVYDAVQKNATQAKLSSDGLSIEGAVGGIPFPIPRNGFEALWNHQLSFRGQVEAFTADTYMMPPGGEAIMTSRTYTRLAYPYYAPGQQAGAVEEWARARLDSKEPPAQAGQSLLAIEYLDQLKRPKDAWQLLPGQRRVRKAPSLAYDTPDPYANGLANFDDVYLFMGSMDRYQMKLLGKREIYVPYNNNGMTLKPLAAVVGKGTLNPDHVRWELHRVWVVEASLVPGKRNVAAKRKLYLDEDTWQAVLSDTWDGQGKLWKSGQAFTFVAPDQPIASTLSYALIDLQSGAWVYQFALNAVTTGIMYDVYDSKTLVDYTPSAISGGSAR